MPPSVDTIVKLIVCFWFFVAIVAGLALFLDKFLISFLQNFEVQLFSSMLTSIVLPLFGLLSIYHTFHILIQYIQNPFLLFISIALTIFLQVAFIDQILPYNSQFNSKYLLFRYIYPLWQSYCTNQT